MKKVITLTLLLMLLISSVCMAYTPDSEEWEIIYVENNNAYYIKKDCIQYFDNGNTAIFWLTRANFRTPTIWFYQLLIKKDMTYANLCDIAVMPHLNGAVIGPYTNEKEPYFSDILPNSREEAIYKRVFPMR